jgi:hypothetical protein
MPVATDVATLPDELANATTIFELWELTARAQTAAAQSAGDLNTSVGDVQTAVTTGSGKMETAVHDVRDALTKSVGDVQTAVTTGSGKMETAVHNVRDATRELTLSVREVRTAVSDGAERLAGAIYELTCELRKPRPDGPGYEFLRIIAPEDADEVARMHLDQLEKAVDAAIRAEKLAAFLEHMRRWEDLGPAPNPKRRSR